MTNLRAKAEIAYKRAMARLTSNNGIDAVLDIIKQVHNEALEAAAVINEAHRMSELHHTEYQQGLCPTCSKAEMIRCLKVP